MSTGTLTPDVLRAAFARIRERAAVPEPPMIICHPAEAWRYSLWGCEGWKWRQWHSFVQFWRYRRFFTDYEILVVLSSILKGQYP